MASLVNWMYPSSYRKLMLLVYMMTFSLLVFLILMMENVKYTPVMLHKANNGLTDIDSVVSDRHSLTKARQESASFDELGEGHFVSECPISAFPEHRFNGNTWQNVGPHNWTLVFSAWYDERDTGWVKIIGLSLKSPKTHYCQFWYNENEHGSVITGMKFSDAEIKPIESGRFK